MSTRRALALSFLDRYASHVLGVISIVTLSRLLTPREIGLYAVTMVFVSLVSTLRDFGAGQYLVQEKDLTVARIRAVWSLQLGLGCALCALVIGCRAPVARFFGEPEIESIMLIVALNFAVSPFGSITYAWLTRHMMFGRLAILRLGGALANHGVAIALAVLGWGAASLAWGYLAGAIATAAIATCLRDRTLPWLPGLDGLPKVAAFGLRATLFGIMQTVRIETPLFLLGRFQGVVDASMFSRANGFMNLPQTFLLQAVHTVTLPLFSRAERAGEKLDALFLRAFAYTAALGWSFAIAASLLADPCVRLLYGEQWLAAIPVLRIVAIGAGLGMPLYLCAQVLISKGRIGDNVRYGAISTIATFAVVLMAAPVGLLAVAWASVLAALVMFLLWVPAVARNLGLAGIDVMATLGQSLLVALFANALPLVLVAAYGTSPGDPLSFMVLAIAGGLAGFTLGLHVCRHPMRHEVTLLREHLGTRLGSRRGR